MVYFDHTEWSQESLERFRIVRDFCWHIRRKESRMWLGSIPPPGCAYPALCLIVIPTWAATSSYLVSVYSFARWLSVSHASASQCWPHTCPTHLVRIVCVHKEGEVGWHSPESERGSDRFRGRRHKSKDLPGSMQKTEWRQGPSSHL